MKTLADSAFFRSIAVLAFLGVAGLSSPKSFAADGSPWPGEPESGYFSISYVMQTADKFYAGASKGPTPGGEDLQQGTLWLGANYVVADAWTVDMQLGWAKSDFITGPGIPAGDDSYDGIVDASFGLTWRIVDEFASDAPSVAIRAGAIVAGDYETGHINSLGDGGGGWEVSLIVGKFFGDRLGLSGEFGYRDRSKGIPTNYFTNLSGFYLASDRLSLGLDYKRVDSASGLDIGGPGFTPARFPETEEETQLIGGRLFYSFADRLSLALHYGKVISGRNTAASSVFGASLSYAFSSM